MPDNGVLDYNSAMKGRPPLALCPLADERKKFSRFSGEAREFFLIIFILITCIASLGICAQLYWDTTSQLQRLAKDIELVRRDLTPNNENCKAIKCRQYEDKLQALENEIKKLESTVWRLEGERKIDGPDLELDETDSESESEETTQESDETDDSDNGADDEEASKSVENITQQGRKSAHEKLGQKEPLEWAIEPMNKPESYRRRRSAHSTTGKNEKRSLIGNRMNSECENNDCDEPEIETKIKLAARKQELDDQKLTSDNSKSNEMTSPESNGHYNSTREAVEQSTTAAVKFTKNKKDKPKRRAKAEIEEEEPEVDIVEEQVVAVHYGGQTANYIHHRHAQYLGNGHLLHPGGVFKDWEASPWVRSMSMDRHFHLKDNGTLMVTKPGLYFVYAQIYYSNAHSLSSYRVYRNDESLLQCTVEMHNKPEKTRNTCFTGGLVYLNAHDQLLLKEVEGERITIFEKTKSFFGLFRVSQS